MTYREQEMPAEADRSILVIAINGRVRGLDRFNGALRWANDLFEGGTGPVHVAFRYGVLVVSAGGKQVFRLDYTTGATLWSAPTRSEGRATIVIEPDLIVIAKGGYIDAFSHAGQHYWQQPLTGLGTGRIALAFPGNVAQADDAGGQ
jgi:outer membrane protein assembly factor BamB